MPEETIEVSCPTCGTAVSFPRQALTSAPALALACPGCAARFPAAAAVLRKKAQAIAPVGDVDPPFDRLDGIGRFVTTGSG